MELYTYNFDAIHSWSVALNRVGVINWFVHIHLFIRRLFWAGLWNVISDLYQIQTFLSSETLLGRLH